MYLQLLYLPVPRPETSLLTWGTYAQLGVYSPLHTCSPSGLAPPVLVCCYFHHHVDCVTRPCSSSIFRAFFRSIWNIWVLKCVLSSVPFLL